MKLLTIKEIMFFLSYKSNRRLIDNLKNTPFELKKLEGVKKKVKHYKFENLPECYRLNLKDSLEFNESEYIDNSDNRPNEVPDMKKYLSVSLNKQEEARLRLKVVLAYEKKLKEIKIEQFIKDLHYDFDELKVSKHKIHRWQNKVNEARIAGVSLTPRLYFL